MARHSDTSVVKSKRIEKLIKKKSRAAEGYFTPKHHMAVEIWVLYFQLGPAVGNFKPFTQSPEPRWKWSEYEKQTVATS